MHVDLTCRACGRAFSVVASKATRRRHCSVACYRAAPTAGLVVMEDGAVGIPLSGRDGSIRAHVVVDVADVAFAMRWRWSLNRKGYAHRKIGTANIWLHRELLGLPRVKDGPEGDHIDRETLNCRRSNLRVVPGGKNQQNQPSQRGSSSPFRGVCWDKLRGLWLARVKVKGKTVNLGRFDDEHEAGEVARAARLRLLPYAVD
jgi:hypothetical protein